MSEVYHNGQRHSLTLLQRDLAVRLESYGYDGGRRLASVQSGLLAGQALGGVKHWSGTE